MSNVLRRHYDPNGYGSNPFLRFVPAGDFYSPVPDLEFIDRHKAALFDQQPKSVPGVELNEGGQLALVGTLFQYYGDLPFQVTKSDGLRYYFDNIFLMYFGLLCIKKIGFEKEGRGMKII